jgi:hypothetical protein
MTQEVERLSALLSRVQENRRKPRVAEQARAGSDQARGGVQARTATSQGAPAQARAGDAAAQARGGDAAAQARGGDAAAQARGGGEPRAMQFEALDERHVAKGSPPPPPPQPAKRPSVDRRPTPLEMAVTGELDREVATGSMSMPEPRPPADVRREAPARAVRPATVPIEPPAPPAGPPVITPRVIEPDPPRELARPIAQVVSKHAPPADATFGALLKRSLSLRPH